MREAYFKLYAFVEFLSKYDEEGGVRPEKLDDMQSTDMENMFMRCFGPDWVKTATAPSPSSGGFVEKKELVLNGMQLSSDEPYERQG